MKFSLAKSTAGDRVFYTLTFIFLTLFFLVVLYPCVFVVSASFSSGQAVQSGRVLLLPVDPTLAGYRTVFNTRNVWLGFRNSIFYTAAATIGSVILTMTASYCLARKDLPGRGFFIFLYTFTMFFSGGLIPSYLLNRSLGLINKIWIMIIPGVGAWNMIIGKTFIQNSIPGELFDAATMDGCSDFYYFVRIVIPLSKAIIAVFALFIGVASWNSYFHPMIYLNNRSLYPLTIFLREVLLVTQIDPSTVEDPELQARIAAMAAIIKYALIVVSTVPVIVIYPFVQKHFVKGVLIGSIKG